MIIVGIKKEKLTVDEKRVVQTVLEDLRQKAYTALPTSADMPETTFGGNDAPAKDVMLYLAAEILFEQTNR